MASLSVGQTLNVHYGRDVSQPINHDSRVRVIISLNGAFAVVVAVLVTIRLVVRWKMVGRIGPDDILMALAAFFFVGLCATCIVATTFGFGRHTWDLDPETIVESISKLNKASSMGANSYLAAQPNVLQTLLVIGMLYATAVTTTKISITAAYLRVLPTPFFQRLMYITAAVVLSMWICYIFAVIFRCNPVKASWDLTIKNPKCLNILDFLYVAASANVLTDLVLCTSPLPLLWKLNISVRERVILCVLFSTGLFATVASAIRLSLLWDIESSDLSYAPIRSTNWSVAEVGAGIICASIPTMKPLFKRLLPAQFSSHARSRNSTWTPRHGHSVAQGPEARDMEMEMKSFSKGDAASKDVMLNSRVQVTRTFSTESITTQGSGEERLVHIFSEHQVNRDTPGPKLGRAARR